ncbi:hypothetical protein FPZ12_008790 [Amycolatopsis acidicola]|uniref:YihY/virulence factor BrkB family protein n=1 Tax=Amycolatopsis acidicola TaxID=2596893 RepID=A0A5N0VB35_9PSEU|nr:YhjD/YihY/BrkB family envelope integrity protein [Amycolatopsis acidicola]KAA9163597.1 hypothetical protein FPZ12_008790 [Amycolatopsis acidicola]
MASVARARAKAARFAQRTGRGLQAAADRHPVLGTALEVLRRDREVSGRLLSAALAFRLFLWLLPCTLLVVALLGFGAGHERDLAGRAGLSPITGSLLDQVGNQAHESRYVLALLGAASLCVAGFMLGQTFDSLRARVQPGSAPTQTAGRRAVRYSALVLGLTATCLLSPLLRSGAHVPAVLVSVCTLVVFVLLGMVMLRTGDSVSRWEALPGALVFAVGLEGLRLIAAYFLPAKLSRASELYGTLGVAAALLVWLTLISRIVVVAHVLNAVLARPARGRG